MLNASYNLPSEDCDTEKQMVLHSNESLCMQSGVLAFGCLHLRFCRWQTKGGAVSLQGRGFLQGLGVTRQAPGASCSSDASVREC